MTFNFRPALDFTDRHGVFVALIGGTNSGKTFSALRLARGIAGPKGKIAVLDTEGGRTLHLKGHFQFDANLMGAPFQPARFSEAAQAAEEAGYDVLLIDSFSMEWVGMGGVLDWQEAELQRMAGADQGKRERVKGASWIRPKMAHKAMVYSFLQRRMPIIFSIRGEETFIPPATKKFKPVCNSAFPFELTVAFRLASERRGYIDLSDPTSFKMESAHRAIFKDGEQLSEQHGEALAAWARGEGAKPSTAKPAPAREPGGDATPRPTWTRADGKAVEFQTVDEMVGQIVAWADKQTAQSARDAARERNKDTMAALAAAGHGDAMIRLSNALAGKVAA